ncbi:hypothetical protein HDV00_012602 [Rhizophlyctis rosea]|nr:hypothetical protein HDV00_012602 [Rhizophlyctis rosea]
MSRLNQMLETVEWEDGKAVVKEDGRVLDISDLQEWSDGLFDDDTGFNSKWLGRVWTMQEGMLAKKLLMFNGVGGGTLHLVWRDFLEKQYDKRVAAGGEPYHVLAVLHRFIRHLGIIFGLVPTDADDVWGILSNLSLRKSYLPQDKIYGAMSILRLPPDFAIDYDAHLHGIIIRLLQTIGKQSTGWLMLRGPINQFPGASLIPNLKRGVEDNSRMYRDSEVLCANIHDITNQGVDLTAPVLIPLSIHPVGENSFLSLRRPLMAITDLARADPTMVETAVERFAKWPVFDDKCPWSWFSRHWDPKTRTVLISGSIQQDPVSLAELQLLMEVAAVTAAINFRSMYRLTLDASTNLGYPSAECGAVLLTSAELTNADAKDIILVAVMKYVTDPGQPVGRTGAYVLLCERLADGRVRKFDTGIVFCQGGSRLERLSFD